MSSISDLCSISCVSSIDPLQDLAFADYSTSVPHWFSQFERIGQMLTMNCSLL
jgi:hypothetical protein